MHTPHPQPAPGSSLAHWTDWLADADIPVLRPSAQALALAADREDDISPRELAEIVLRDPLLTARLYVHVARFRSGRAAADITAVERMIVMLGVPPFLNAMRSPPTIEERLASHGAALSGLVGVIRRARHAADIAVSLAVWRNDLGYEEIREAAMLHDLAEMLAWCFAPQPMMQIAQRQAANPALRSATLQDAILGFRLADLQMALAERWHLPGLLVSMMDDAHAAQPRERCVSCAVSVARHAAHGWDDAALPDDYQAIADLLQITPERAHELVRSVD